MATDDPTLYRLHVNGNSPQRFIDSQLHESSTIGYLKLNHPLKEELLETILEHVNETNTLVSFTASKNAIDEINLPYVLSILDKSPSLLTLIFSDSRLERSFVKKVMKFCNLKSSLKILDLSNNKIDTGTLEGIWKSLRKNTNLISISLSRIDHSKVNEDIIEKTLIRNKSLTELDLSAARLCSRTKFRTDLSFLSSALSKNNQIVRFNLSSNMINDQSLHSLSMGLTQNISLTHLDLSDNRITLNPKNRESSDIEPINWFLAILNIHPKIESINLSGNKIDNFGLRELTKTLLSDTHARSLDISDNFFNSRAIHHIDNLLMEKNCISLKINNPDVNPNDIIRLEQFYDKSLS
jgi:Ran GTPase-activating protein (RanGAP) involved in mRNA processing and transport